MRGSRARAGRRRTVRLFALALPAVAVLHRLFVRPRLLTWGATVEEAERTYPGDALVPGAASTSTMAVTLPAPPEEVWPWLAQLGCDRGGWYGWDGLVNGGRPSAERVVPQWQDVRVGRRVTVTPCGESWFTVAEVEPERTLVLRVLLELPSGRPFDPRSEPRPWAYADAVWGFHLGPAPGGGTRLVARVRSHGRPRPLMRAVEGLLREPWYPVLQARQFRALGDRVAGRI
ncbi:hypothetical protein [Streptomyces zingiberis]|uniref:SRPBCC family protein n=1 Tax=Streptomyces zingiberis TaxID=2053010 RepID=A0ABX1C4Z0_9ACTN|nr:hypothetical protein [Streptomyces zingiberis]NJQ03866.1 hypothetical protein [Streptomyces zingiberis]